MIDASRSPRLLWVRVATVLLLAALIVLAAWTIWVKELHHPLPGHHPVKHAAAAVLVAS